MFILFFNYYIFIYLYIYLLFNSESKLKNKDKWLMVMIILSTFVVISISLYISCTPVNFDYIIGIQGRYFLPLLFPLYLVGRKNSDSGINISIYLVMIYLVYFLNYV